LLDQKNQGRARVKIAVFVVLAIHGIGLLALLMQGCKKEPDATVPPPLEHTDTNAAPTTFVEPTNTPPAVTNEPLVTSNVPPAVLTEPVAPPSVPATTSEYKVAKGDSFSSIAKKMHVSAKALQEANPGIEPTKLQIGQTLHIPAPLPATTGNGSTATAPTDSTGGMQTYSVKSGDSLTKIASQFGTTVKAIRAANNLKSDRIVVGQKLQIPAKAAPAPAPATSAPNSTVTQ
jgi:LysM repeat protein